MEEKQTGTRTPLATEDLQRTTYLALDGHSMGLPACEAWHVAYFTIQTEYSLDRLAHGYPDFGSGQA